jgi:hypothetical protein
MGSEVGGQRWGQGNGLVVATSCESIDYLEKYHTQVSKDCYGRSGVSTQEKRIATVPFHTVA